MTTKDEALKLALKRAFNLGQTYWQQVDSEYPIHWKKGDVTLASFNQLVEDTIREALAEQPAQQTDEFLLRGILASQLKCWHRLTEDEAKNLVAFVQNMPSKPAQQQSCYCQNCEALSKELAAIKAQQQEPFCYHDGRNIVGKEFADHSDVFPLYTSPPPRKPWVGLTDEDKSELDEKYGDDMLAHLDAIEAKLKEKNT